MAVENATGGSTMSAMLGSSRRNSQPRPRFEGDQIVLVERPTGTFRFWAARLIAWLETVFGPAKLRP